MTPEDLIAKWETKHKHLSNYLFAKIQAKEWEVNKHSVEEIIREISVVTQEIAILKECIDDLKVVKFINKTETPKMDKEVRSILESVAEVLAMTLGECECDAKPGETGCIICGVDDILNNENAELDND